MESELTDLQDDYNEITSENLTHIQNQIDRQNTNINTLAQKIAEQNDEMENVEMTLSTYVEEQIQDLLLEQQTSAFGTISCGYNCVAAGYSETIFQNNPFTTNTDGNPFYTENWYGDISCWYDQSETQYIQNSNPFGL